MDVAMPKDLDSAIKQPAVRMVLEQLPEYASLNLACVDERAWASGWRRYGTGYAEPRLTPGGAPYQ